MGISCVYTFSTGSETVAVAIRVICMAYIGLSRFIFLIYFC